MLLPLQLPLLPSPLLSPSGSDCRNCRVTWGRIHPDCGFLHAAGHSAYDLQRPKDKFNSKYKYKNDDWITSALMDEVDSELTVAINSFQYLQE